MPASARHAGIIKPIIGTSVRHAGVIKPVIGGWVNVAGVWKPALRYPLTAGAPSSFSTTADIGGSYTGTAATGAAPTAGHTRHILCMVAMPLISNNSRTASLSVGGVAAALLIAREQITDVSAAYAAAYLVELPTGESHAFSYTPPRTTRGASISFIPIYDIGSVTPIANDGFAATSSAGASLSLASGGRLTAGVAHCYNGGTFSVTGGLTSYFAPDTNSGEWALYAGEVNPAAGPKTITFPNSSTCDAIAAVALAFD
ncbi:hypothetical protein DFR52_106226 [Hoeflea marina]|uniref:Uncharacterized protein n=1 Tax=Hoeflea marina TaxID=274592 RepID=A0A317PGC3_9HYPH|nr:hypothetical protein [Hoeflea marina]PWV97701.1 hypothetical protein DFR52_106226 [Hoeflea marina]